jgi:putative flippase GtrA
MSAFEPTYDERRGWAHHTRRAVRRGAPELRTLVKFTLVGGSGYAVNLAVFAIAQAAGAHHVLAATLAFLAAVGNNFHWNRRWTFNAVGAEAVHRQAHRFLIVSVISFLVSLAILVLLVGAGVTPLLAQAISIALATPLGFIGNRLWTFAAPGSLRRHARRLRDGRAAASRAR